MVFSNENAISHRGNRGYRNYYKSPHTDNIKETIINKDRRQIRDLVDLATKEARKSSMTLKHGSVIVRDRKIIATGHNVSFERKEDGRWSLHAEIKAMMNCHREYLKGASIFVVRLSDRGVLMNSKPCNRCAVAIIKAGISNVFYSVNSDDSHCNRTGQDRSEDLSSDSCEDCGGGKQEDPERLGLIQLLIFLL